MQVVACLSSGLGSGLTASRRSCGARQVSGVRAGGLPVRGRGALVTSLASSSGGNGGDDGLPDGFPSEDPEKKGRKFWILPNFSGGIPTFSVESSKQSEKRKKDQLAELAMLNARLAGKSEIECAEARKRLEWLKIRRNNWSAIYHTVTKVSATVTLEGIEEANRKVNHVLSEEERDKKSVSSLREELLGLQSEVREANKKLQFAQMRVEQNLYEIEDMRQEAVRLEALQESVCSDCVDENETPKWEDQNLYQ